MNQSEEFKRLNSFKSFSLSAVVILIIFTSFPFLFAQQPTDWISLLPEGEGKKEVTTLCSNCHSLQLIVSQRKTADQWK